MRAARLLDMPFFFSPSYCFSFFTLGLLFGISASCRLRCEVCTQARGHACPAGACQVMSTNRYARARSRITLMRLPRATISTLPLQGGGA